VIPAAAAAVGVEEAAAVEEAEYNRTERNYSQ